MRIIDLFSKRQQRLRGEVKDVLVYDQLPHELRVQVIHIFRDYLGTEQDSQIHGTSVFAAFQFIVDTLCREYGMFSLPTANARRERNYFSELFNFILTETNVDRVLDAIELGCRIIDIHSRKWEYKHSQNGSEEADAGLAELNARFLHHGFGYRYESRNIIRVDSELIHAEVIKPALALLHNPKFKGAEAEFHLAFEHYRHARPKEALTECLKCLESTIKAIALARGWAHEPNATAKPLLDLMFEKQVIPQLWSQHFSGLRAMLESGVPTARNRLGGHGQGAEIITVPLHFVSFTLHQTAAAIVFLASAEQNLKP